MSEKIAKRFLFDVHSPSLVSFEDILLSWSLLTVAWEEKESQSIRRVLRQYIRTDYPYTHTNTNNMFAATQQSVGVSRSRVVASRCVVYFFLSQRERKFCYRNDSRARRSLLFSNYFFFEPRAVDVNRVRLAEWFLSFSLSLAARAWEIELYATRDGRKERETSCARVLRSSAFARGELRLGRETKRENSPVFFFPKQ